MAGKHLVVDGSNIATEGRTAPSLLQLDEAVRALVDERGYERVTVVVDATFGHRIDRKERHAYEEAVAAGEMVTPPAGAIGRGDAFVLQIADKANADVLSNDSFQEFHGQYQWLFDEGRLIGGKPIEGVGWVFVLRAPVRGPTSRKSVRDAKVITKSKRAPVPAAPVTPAPVTPAPAAAATAAPVKAPRGSRPRRRSAAQYEPVNEKLVYAHFVVEHPIGSLVEGEVERFSSHGAYVSAGRARCYVPLKLMGDPPPRSAREVMRLGETQTFVVERFDPEGRGIDLALPGAVTKQADRGRVAAKAAASAAGTHQQPHTAEEAPVSPAAKKAAAKKAPARKTAAAKKTVAKRAPAKKATARKTAAKRTTAAKRAPAKRAPARKTAAKKAPARKTAAKKAPARKTAAKRAPARKTAAKKAPAKRTTKR